MQKNCSSCGAVFNWDGIPGHSWCARCYQASRSNPLRKTCSRRLPGCTVFVTSPNPYDGWCDHCYQASRPTQIQNPNPNQLRKTCTRHLPGCTVFVTSSNPAHGWCPYCATH